MKVNSAIRLLEILKVVVGKPGIIELHINDHQSFLIGNNDRRIQLSDVMAVLAECEPNDEIDYIRYDPHTKSYWIVWL